MLTLTETAALTKKSFIFGIIFLVVSITAWAGWQYYYNYIYLPSLPKVEEKPELKFGALPKLDLPEIKSPQNVNYVLSTDTGDVPKDIPKLIKVYSVAQLGTDLLALDKAKKLAAEFGFEDTPQALSTTEYQFRNPTGGILRIDLDTGNFKYTKPEATESARFDDNYFVEEAKVIEDFKRYLNNKKLLPDQLKDGPSQIFLDQPSIREAKRADISLWQGSIDEIPIVTTTFDKGLINATVNKNLDDEERYIGLEYIFWPIDTNNVSTYTLKRPQEAFEKLENGEATLVIPKQLTDLNSNSISITKIYLAYLLSKTHMQYLQPVYVFEGENFVAILPAVDDAEVTQN